MSRNMRPEVRRWGPSAGVFVATETAVDLLAAVSQAGPEIGMEYVDEVSRDQYRVVWDDGAAILDRFAELDDRKMAEAVAAVDELRRKDVERLDDALGFLANLRACADSWRAFCDPDDGSFELLIDA